MENEWDGKVKECEKMREGHQPAAIGRSSSVAMRVDGFFEKQKQKKKEDNEK